MSRRSVFSLFFVVLLIGAGLFTWQVFSYYQKIVDGSLTTTDLPSYNFANRLTTSALARAASNGGAETADVISSDDPSLGNPGALLTIVEFADFGCSYSAEASHTLRRAAQNFGGLVRYIYRDFPLADIHPDAVLAAEAGGCANEQDQFWAYHDKLYQNQSALGRDDLLTYASQVGLSRQKFESCLNSGRYKEEVREDMRAGEVAGVYGTPTFFFNGHRIEGAIPEETLTQIIEAFTSGT